MKWTNIKTEAELQSAINTKDKIALIFKHSCRCGTSFYALDKLENNWNHEEMSHVDTYFLDVIEHRELSRSTSSIFNIPHQSPQVFVVKEGACIYESSHHSIKYDYIKDLIHNELVKQ